MNELTYDEVLLKERKLEEILFKVIDGQLEKDEIDYIINEVEKNLNAKGVYLLCCPYGMGGYLRHKYLHLNNFKTMAIIGYIIKKNMTNMIQIDILKSVVHKMSKSIEEYGFYGDRWDEYNNRTASYNLINNIGLRKLFDELLPLTLGALNEFKKLEKYLKK